MKNIANIKMMLFVAFSIMIMGLAWFIYDWKNPNYEKKFKQNSEEFIENRIFFEKVIQIVNTEFLILKKGTSLSKFSNDFSQKYNEQLEEIGVQNIKISFVENSNCPENLICTFNIKKGYNIRTLKVVKIIYSPCNKETKLGYHFNSNHIDINGEGNNWLIFSDTDFN